jgi:hypothetical protein
MKVVLRKVDTGEYCSLRGWWTHDAEFARDFGYVPDAVDFAIRRGLRNVQVALVDPVRGSEMDLPAMPWAEAVSH